MGQSFDYLPDNLLEWARQQPIFWVATSPLSKEGHINLSPKGCHGLCFISIEPHRMIYEDLSGSGAETIAHIRENERITILFQSFEAQPRLCRLYGTGSYHEFGSPEYDAYIPIDKRSPGSRAVIMIDIHKVITSCGYAVPYFEYKGDRFTLHNWSSGLEKPDADPQKNMHEWWQRKCAQSIDGMPALEVALTTVGTPLKNTWTLQAPKPKAKEASPAVKAADTRSWGSILKGWVDQKFVGGLAVGLSLSIALMSSRSRL